MSKQEIYDSLREINLLFDKMRGSFNTLTIQIDSIEVGASVSVNEYSEMPNSGGMKVRKMPNLHDDSYSVVEVMGPIGGEGHNLVLQHQAIINVMKGRMALQLEDEPWFEISVLENNPTTIPLAKRHSFRVLEEFVSVNIFTPPLP